MPKVWFTSDLHFGHKNIIRFQENRVNLMGLDINNPDCDKIHTQYLIEHWNSTIGKKDIVYILGDVSFYNKEETKKILEKLNGIKHLIIGNHDKSCNGLDNYFESVSKIKMVVFKKHEYDFLDENLLVNMCHFPILSWDRRQHGAFMVHGHCHGNCDEININSQELRVDVGYDSALSRSCGGFISLEDLYNHFMEMIKSHNCLTFREYIEQKMVKDGTRL